MKTDTIQTRKWITTCLVALFTFCLVLAGMLFITPIEAEAAVGDNFLVDNIVYTVLSEAEGDKRVSVTAHTLTENTELDIPETVENNGTVYTVTAIGTNAFQNCTYLTKVELPATLTTINARAFTGCSDLREVRMYSKTANIGQGAFPSEGVEDWYFYPDSTMETYVPANHEGLYGMHDLFDVTFDYNYGTAGTFTVDKPLAVGETIKLPLLGDEIATRKGYLLASLSCNNGTTYTNSTLITNRTVTMISGGLTFTVNWSPKTYTVTLDPNGGDYQGTTVTATYGDVLPVIQMHYPFRAGYTFNGYFKNQSGATGTQYYQSDMTPVYVSWLINSNDTIYARWTPNTYSVTYNLDGGTHDECIDFTATYDESYVFLPETAPTKPGYTFAGWTYYFAMDVHDATEDMIGQEVVFDFAEDIVFTAVWRERAPVRLEIDEIAKKQSYFLNDAVVPFGGTIYYDNGESERVTFSTRDILGFSTDEIQREPVTAIARKQGISDTFTYTVDYDYENCNHVFVQSNILVAKCTDCDTAVILEKDFTSHEYDGSEKPIIVLLRDGVFDISGLTVSYSRTDGQTHASNVVPVNPGKYRATTVLGDCVLTYDYEIYITYTVQYWTENTDGTYSLYAENNDKRSYDGWANELAVEIPNFVAQQLGISRDVEPNTVIQFYYDRQTYPLTFDAGSLGSYGDASTVTVDAKWDYPLYEYVAVQPIPEYDDTMYVFRGWSPNDIPEIQMDAIITESSAYVVPMGPMTVYAVITERMLTEIEIPEDKLVQWYSKLSTEKFREFDVILHYDNGTTETLTVTQDMLSDFSLNDETPLDESCTATVSYGGLTATFTYYVRNIGQLEYYVDNLDSGEDYSSDVIDYYEGQVIPLMDGSSFIRTGYTFIGWEIWDGDLGEPVFYELGSSYTIRDDDVVAEGVWRLNEPTLTGTAGGALNYIYTGSAHNVTVNPSHELGNGVSYTFRWFRLNEGEANIDSVDFSTDDLFESRCELLTTSSGTYGSYRFTDVADSGVYYCVVTATDGANIPRWEYSKNTSQTAFEFTVSIEKAEQTITLSEDEFTYSEGMTIDLADLIGGTGDGALSFEVSDQSGVEFDFANGVVSNITRADGTFTLTVNKAASDNYNERSETFTVTLNKGVQTLSASGTPSAPSWKEGFAVSVSGNKGALSYAITSGNATVNNGVITATGVGEVSYTVTAAETDLYEAATQEFSVTFGKAAGNLAPDYELPTGLSICVGRSSDDITLPSDWRFESETIFEQTGTCNVDAIFTPEDQVNYEEYRTSVQITVLDHVGGTAASCTSVQTCTECGKVLVEALGHNYTEQADNEIRTTAQNCQDFNTYWYDCSLCGESARNDANATDRWYTSTEAGAHSMSADWTSENGQHFHKCTVAGCTYTENRTNCTGGMATCQSPAICSVCQNPYGSVTYHHFYDTGEWGYKGTDGHAHKCLYCDAYDTVIPHTPNVEAATEDTAKYCTVSGCGFVIEQRLDHVHSEGTAWKHDSEYHWHDCVANDGQVYSKAAHTYDNACDTTCNGGCGYVRAITHDYSELEKNDTQHWYVCGICGEEKESSRVGHSGGTASCQTLANCSTCGQAYGSLGAHDYDTTKWVSIDENYHAHKCKLCDAYTEQTAHFSEDGATCTEAKACDACGYTMEDALQHSYTERIETTEYLKAEGEDCQSHHTYYYACERCGESSKDDTDTFFAGAATGAHKMSDAWTTEYAEDSNAGWHYHACTVDGCDYREEEGDCAGGESTCLVLAVCNTCQKPYGTYAEHTFGATWEYKDDAGHAHVCEVKGCNAHGEIQAHNPNIPAATEDEAQVCEDCGYLMAPVLEHTTHTPEAEWQKSETHHWHECTGCDGQELDKAAHNDGNSDGSCDACGYTMTVTPPPHTHAHGTTWETDEAEHWNECACGDKANKAAHADSDNNGKCDTCDYTMSAGTDDPGTEPTPNPPTPNPPANDNDGLGTGAIIAIVAASIVTVGGGGFALVWFIIRKRRGF